MKTRPYLTFDGQCKDAIDLYKKAFNTDTIEVMLFSQMPEDPNYPVPENYKNRILQATLKMGDDYIRLSDCGYMPDYKLNEQETDRIAIALEAKTVEEIKHAFNTLAEGGKVGLPLMETFYSPCAGVITDKFGVQWNMMATNTVSS